MSSSPTDPYDLDAAEEQRTQRDKATKADAQQESSDTVWLMSSKRGRRMVWRQLERAGVFRLSFNTNAMQMAFAEGNRNEGLRTLAACFQHCPESFVLMLKEANE